MGNIPKTMLIYFLLVLMEWFMAIPGQVVWLEWFFSNLVGAGFPFPNFLKRTSWLTKENIFLLWTLLKKQQKF
jgi:hypothetical protein